MTQGVVPVAIVAKMTCSWMIQGVVVVTKMACSWMIQGVVLVVVIAKMACLCMNNTGCCSRCCCGQDGMLINDTGCCCSCCCGQDGMLMNDTGEMFLLLLFRRWLGHEWMIQVKCSSCCYSVPKLHTLGVILYTHILYMYIDKCIQ